MHAPRFLGCLIQTTTQPGGPLRSVRLWVVLMLACFASADGQQPVPDTEPAPIRIGHVNSLTGKEAVFGNAMNNGVMLAAQEINAAGGVMGQRLEIIIRDTQSQTQNAATEARHLLDSFSVVAFIGDIASGRSMTMTPSAESHGIPMVTAATNARITLDDRTGQALSHVFRITLADPTQGVVMARFAAETLGLRSVAILKDSLNSYSVELAEQFRDEFTAMGRRITTEQTYEWGENVFEAQLNAIKVTRPQAIYVPGYYMEVSLAATQARDLSIALPSLGGDGWESPVLLQGAAGDALQNCYFTTHFSPSDTSRASRAFTERFKRRYGELPDVMAALGYDALQTIAHVIRQSGGAEPQAITEGLATLKDFPSLTGPLSIDEHHNADRPMVINRIDGGEIRYYSTVR